MIETITVPLKKSNSLLSLSDNTFLRYFNFIALFMAQGIRRDIYFMASVNEWQ